MSTRKKSVLKDWVADLPWKQQSILFSGLRGYDGEGPWLKHVHKWMRAVTQENADPSKGYMNTEARRLPDAMDVVEELEYKPCHYVHHLADALAVIAYGAPDPGDRYYAYEIHALIAEELFHFLPESEEIFRWRHRDKPDGVDPSPERPYDDRLHMEPHLPPGFKHV